MTNILSKNGSGGGELTDGRFDLTDGRFELVDAKIECAPNHQNHSLSTSFKIKKTAQRAVFIILVIE